MTDQEIERLREKLGSKYSVKRNNGAITVELADVWDGVEFAECVEYCKGSRTGKEIIKGHIYKITDWFKHQLVYFDGFEYGWPVLLFKPSTESAYVDQLKAKAKELYGEIKDGDRFDISMLEEDPQEFRMFYDNPIFTYYKKDDSLWAGNYPIYKQGKWAKKVEETIKVNVSSIRYLREPIEYMGELIPSDTIDCTVHFTIEGSSRKVILKDDFRNLLSKCLEDYLNKIP